MVALFVTRRLSAIASTNLPTILLRSQPCTLESIRRRHGMLLQLSRLAVTSARFATSRMQSTGSQPVKHPISNFVGSWRIQHRSSSTNGPGKSPDVKTKTGESIPTQTTKMKTENPLPEGESPMTMWQKFLAPKPMPERYSASWYREVLLICTVFAITGSTTMVIVRPAVSEGLGIKGNFIDGPWSYRICSIVIMTPIYATLLVCVGTIFGRHAYFRHFSVKIFSRFGIPPELMDPTYHKTKASFRKW